MKLKAALSAVLLAAAVLVAPPAHASPCYTGHCAKLYHNYDAGYAAALDVKCNYSSTVVHHIGQGHNTGEYCGSVDLIIVRPGQEIWCQSGIGQYSFYTKKWDATGPHHPDPAQNINLRCVSHAD